MIERPFAVSPFGRERRSNEALNQLARKHYNLCRNAADPFELAAQLESLGYNRYRVKREFGLRNTFELAERLFALTPRRPHLASTQHSVASPFWWQFATLVALALSLLLYSTSDITPHYSMFAWLLTWTVTGHYLMSHLGTADFSTKKRMFTLLLVTGFVGLALTAYLLQVTSLEAALGLLWWQLPATFWPSSFAPQQRLRHFVVSVLAGFAFFIPPLATVLLLLLAAVLLFAPFLARPRGPYRRDGTRCELARDLLQAQRCCSLVADKITPRVSGKRVPLSGTSSETFFYCPPPRLLHHPKFFVAPLQHDTPTFYGFSLRPRL